MHFGEIVHHCISLLNCRLKALNHLGYALSELFMNDGNSFGKLFGLFEELYAVVGELGFNLSC